MTASARKAGSCEHVPAVEDDASQPRQKSHSDEASCEVFYLKRIVAELEGRIKVLDENNDLLRFKVTTLQDRLCDFQQKNPIPAHFKPSRSTSRKSATEVQLSASTVTVTGVSPRVGKSICDGQAVDA